MASTSELEPQLHPHQPVLTPALSERWMLGLEHVLVVLAAAVFFCILNALALRPSDLWGHVLYGQWILENQALPVEDPFFPLAVGMPVVDAAWGSQILFTWVYQIGGAEGLSLLFAATVFATYAVFMRVFYVQCASLGRTSRVLVSFFMTVAALNIGWSRISTIRPENFAMLLFAALLWLLVAEDNKAEDAPTTRFYGGLSTRLWLGVPVLFALWANLHGSFLCGLCVLACWFVGQLLETAWRERSFAAAVSNRQVQGWLLLGELATLATCLNPYGPNLLLNVLFFADNSNLKQLVEWQPLAILGVGGRGFAFSWILLLVAMRFSRAPLKLAHILTFAVFAVATVSSIRMIAWYAPVVCLLLAPHMASIVGDLVRRWEAAQPPLADDEVATDGLLGRGYSFQFSVACLGIAFIGFAWSPFGIATLWHTRFPVEKRLGSETPVKLVAYLEKHPELLEPNSFCPQQWGDWLELNLGDSFRPFMTSNVHLAPKQTWDDYSFIISVQPGWQRVMDRYHLDVAIVDLIQHPGLAKVLRKDEGWQVLYEDEQALVLKKKPRTPLNRPATTKTKTSGKNDLEIALPGSEEKKPVAAEASTSSAPAEAPAIAVPPEAQK